MRPFLSAFAARLKFPRVRIIPKLLTAFVRRPALTAAEKTALAVLVVVLAAGAALRAWERTGVRLGPVEDWETLRNLVIRAREDHGGGGFSCAETSSAGGFAVRRAGSGAPRPILAAGASGRKALPARPVDVNTADARGLQTLPGIGPATAAAVLAHRAARGPFRRIDDLRAVKGIGPAKLAALRPHVRVAAPADPADSARAPPPPTRDSTTDDSPPRPGEPP